MTRIAIVGAGLAGSSLVHWLLQSGFEGELTLFDANDPMTASVGPTLLCHPFPGRSLAPHPHLHHAVAATLELLNDWKQMAPELIRPTNMWRPLKGSNLKRLSQSHRDWWIKGGRHTAINPWINNPPTIESVTDSDLDAIPSFNTPYPALKTGPAFAIDAGELFPLVHQSFQSQGVSLVEDTVHNITRHNDQWSVETSSEKKCFDQIVLAFGRQTKSWFPHLDITLQSGSLMKSKPKQETPIESLSLNGLHIGQHHDGDWVFGSTRWSSIRPHLDTEKQELLQRLKDTLPFAPTMKEDGSRIWSGTRTIYGSDRMPLCGELPQHQNIFVLTALGSKGWLWGPWTAKLLQMRLQNKKEIDGWNVVDLMRANAEDGWYSPSIES